MSPTVVANKVPEAPKLYQKQEKEEPKNIPTTVVIHSSDLINDDDMEFVINRYFYVRIALACFLAIYGVMLVTHVIHQRNAFAENDDEAWGVVQYESADTPQDVIMVAQTSRPFYYDHRRGPPSGMKYFIRQSVTDAINPQPTTVQPQPEVAKDTEELMNSVGDPETLLIVDNAIPNMVNTIPKDDNTIRAIHVIAHAVGTTEDEIIPMLSQLSEQDLEKMTNFVNQVTDLLYTNPDGTVRFQDIDPGMIIVEDDEANESVPTTPAVALQPENSPVTDVSPTKELDDDIVLE